MSRAALPAGAAGAIFVLVMRETMARIGLTKLGLHITLLELSVALMLRAFGTGLDNRAAAFGTGWLRRIGHHSYETYPSIAGSDRASGEEPIALAQEWHAGLQRVWLHTDRWDHPPAMRLYSSLGFRVFEERDEPVGLL